MPVEAASSNNRRRRNFYAVLLLLLLSTLNFLFFANQERVVLQHQNGRGREEGSPWRLGANETRIQKKVVPSLAPAAPGHKNDKQPTTTADKCVRFATMLPSQRSNGLGHRLTEVVMGMNFAQETNATYLYNDHIWATPGKHGGYKWMTDFLPLQEIEVTRGKDPMYKARQRADPLQISEGPWMQMVEDSKQQTLCNIEMRTSLNKCCPSSSSNNKICWCTKDTARIGTFDAMKGRLRKAFSRSKYSLSVQQQQKQLNGHSPETNEPSPFCLVVWHLRMGDLVLNARREYFSAISTQLALAFQNITSSMVPLIVFVGEGGEQEISESFPFLGDICNKLFSANCLYPDLDVRDSLYHMIHSADILVTSGSSFSAVAGLLRPSTRMTLAARAKEGVVGIYETSEQLLIDEDGSIQRIDELKKYLVEQ